MKADEILNEELRALSGTKRRCDPALIAGGQHGFKAIRGDNMAEAQDKKSIGKIADLVEDLKQREIPAVTKQATVSEIVDAFVASHHSHIIYVVDDAGRLIGVISLGNLVRHVFFLYHDQSIDARSLISMVVSETAEDFMQKEPMVTTLSEDIEDVLQRMIDHNVKEIPILDDDKRIVADLTIVDLLKHYKCIKGPDLS